jgi:hypothetical protein
VPDFFLLGNGTDKLLLANGTDKLLLASSTDVPANALHISGHLPAASVSGLTSVLANALHVEGHLPAPSVTNAGILVAAGVLHGEVTLGSATVGTGAAGSVTAGALHVRGYLGAATIGSATVATYAAGTEPRWRVRIVGLDKAGKAEFTSTSGLELYHPLNGIDECRFTVSLEDPALDEFRFLDRHVEVWLDGSLKFRGPAVRGSQSLDRQTLSVQCYDELWALLIRRVTGRADRPDLLAGLGNFEGSNVAQWSTVGTVTRAEETSIVNEGSKSMKLTSSSGGYVERFAVYEHTYPPGLISRLALDYYIPLGSTAPYGLAAELTATDTETGIVYRAFIPSPGAKPGGWHSLYCDLLISKANVPYLMQVKLYGASTGAYFDRVRLVRNEALTLAFPGEDQATMFAKVIQYGQDVAEGKSHLGIGTDCPATGTTIMVGYPHADHRQLKSIIDELTERTDAPDWGLVITPTTTTFTTYYPAKGDTHNEWLLEAGRNILGGSLEIDGSQTTTSAIVVGDNGGFERDEGGHVDTASLSGLVLEDVFRAGQGAAVRFFDQLAEEHVDRRKQLSVIPRLPVADPSRELIHGLEKGDIVPLRVSSPLAQVDGRADYRVVGIRIPQSADRVLLDLAPVPA